MNQTVPSGSARRSTPVTAWVPSVGTANPVGGLKGVVWALESRRGQAGRRSEEGSLEHRPRITHWIAKTFRPGTQRPLTRTTRPR